MGERTAQFLSNAAATGAVAKRPCGLLRMRESTSGLDHRTRMLGDEGTMDAVGMNRVQDLYAHPDAVKADVTYCAKDRPRGVGVIAAVLTGRSDQCATTSIRGLVAVPAAVIEGCGCARVTRG